MVMGAQLSLLTFTSSTESLCYYVTKVTEGTELKHRSDLRKQTVWGEAERKANLCSSVRDMDMPSAQKAGWAQGGCPLEML